MYEIQSGGMQRQLGENLMFLIKKDCRPWGKLDFILRTKSYLKKFQEVTGMSTFVFQKENAGFYAEVEGGGPRDLLPGCCNNLNQKFENVN